MSAAGTFLNMRSKRFTRFGWFLLLGIPVLAAVTVLASTTVVVIAWVAFCLVALVGGAGGSPGIRSTGRVDPAGGTWIQVDPGAEAEERYERRRGMR
jgi:hypothetical protein